MRVLVVDDDHDALALLTNAIEHCGYEVGTASNGLEAIEQIRDCEYRVIVSDWEMPGMSGLDLCQYVRTRATSQYTYFILLTSRFGTRWEPGTL